MDHAVHYRTSAGDTKLEEVPSLEAAVSLVERLRNDEGVSDVRVYRQVPIEFKTYYKVSVVEGAANGQPATATPPPQPSAPQPSAPQQAAPQQAPQQQAPQQQAPQTQAPQDPPPGAMPLGPSQPTAQPSAQAAGEDANQANGGNGEESEGNRRGSLFSRG